MAKPKYPGERVVSNGNQLVCTHTEARLAEAGIFYPITPSTEMGELFQASYAEGKLNVFGQQKLAVEAEGEHAAQGGAIAYSVTGKRVVNFTSGQGITYGVEQYYHAPGKLSTLVVEVAARALTKHALNVHCGHDDICAALDVGWIMLMARDAQQASDQALIIRKVTELALTPAMNIQDGFLTSHLERTFFRPSANLIREFLGAPDDTIDCPTEAQRELFGPTRRRVPKVIDLENPALIGPVQNQEHYMNGVIARRDNFYEPILGFLKDAYKEFGELTGRHYDFVRKYKSEDADTVFFTLGSAAENIEAAIDYVEETRGDSFGSIHLNVIRPFPEEAVIEALAGKKNVIILERTDEPLSTDNPIAKDVRTALSKAVERHRLGLKDGPRLAADQVPRIFSGSYGIGSRDFRPEGILGAYEYATGKIARQDGKTAADGESYFALGIDHPYAVVSKDEPSLLPNNAIAVRLHSIGGWGMITTGKNLGAIIGEFGEDIAEKRNVHDEHGRLEEAIHVSANPRYGSEKKGSPTAYFLVVAPKRIRVNCDLRHVSVVLCCDPKAFTHANPLDGMADGGAFVWESEERPERAWERIPQEYRQQIIDKKIRLFILPGFEIARNATNRADLQLRMQGNAFLGAFFRVSSFLRDNEISDDRFKEVVLRQYQKKFGRFGEAVVASNMTVMTEGFSKVTEVAYGDLEAKDTSKMRGFPLLPILREDRPAAVGHIPAPANQAPRANVQAARYFDDQFRGGHGYHQPAGPLAAVGTMAAATGATASKYVARRETPVFFAENCTQCMKCISACPDTALPNTSQDISAVLSTAIENYVSDAKDREALLAAVPALEDHARKEMMDVVKAKGERHFAEILGDGLASLNGAVSAKSKDEIVRIVKQLPLAYSKVKAIFGNREKKNEGDGGIFSIFVSDLCKGCAACVTECGDHDALRMVTDSEELNEKVVAATEFMDLLPETDQKYLGFYDNQKPQDAKAAVLRNHLMVRKNYQALPSGDGACAGCGEKSVLRSVATITEAFMRPIYHAKADRLRALARELGQTGDQRLEKLKERSPQEHERFVAAVAHIVMGLGGETDDDTAARVSAADGLSDEKVVSALVAALDADAFRHRHLQAVDGRLDNGMSVMAMGAHTGCNTVYGSTPPNNPHPYPWLNSLFQDGATISWMMGESFVRDFGRMSILPERLARHILERDDAVLSPEEFFAYTHFTDSEMTDQEVIELPKVWCIGGDGGMGDIGFQNVSKTVLQNRPNVKLLMLDTQVYSNTGGQNSDSSPMTGGMDMNALGAATQGKLTEKKSVAECFTVGHGSAYIAQVSMADATKLYKCMLDALEYRGTAFFQAFTTCQPEHGVADDMSVVQAMRIRDSRGMPQFVFDPAQGETYQEALDLKGNPKIDRDWTEVKAKSGDRYGYTVAHWAKTEARFRRHFKKAKPDQLEDSIHLLDLITAISQKDVVNRRFLDPNHRAYVPDFGVYIEVDNGKSMEHWLLSRQMVLFCIERRKAWRMLQSRAGIVNKDYKANRALIEKVDAGEINRSDLHQRGRELLEEQRSTL
jgi:pyruvate-ferredoxin/flavodoxin oxidoreductase